MLSTARYRFELGMLDWAERHVLALCGERAAFFLGCREDATVRRVYVAAPFTAWDEAQRARMVAAHPRWLLFAPGAEPGRGHIEWCAVPVPVAARWLGREPMQADLAPLGGGAALGAWPESWSVTV